MDAYEACEHLVNGVGHRWIGSEGPDDYHRTAYHSPLDDLRWVGESELARLADVARRLLLGFLASLV
ncbi:MAG TPA: hypothetical protein VMZ92_19750 [Planctomycetota bacterium]|nr:hypothetical protein [Planctomycetota bacterium]